MVYLLYENVNDWQLRKKGVNLNKELDDRYQRLKEIVIDRKNEFDLLVNYVESQTDWLIAPASTRFHLNKESGLLEHSCNVAENLLRIKDLLAPEISDESCVICGLFHDLGKVGMPGNPLYLLNNPSEKQMKYGYLPEHPYRYSSSLTHLSVPLRSLYYILPYLPLSEEEVQAIAYHDGQYVESNRDVATREKPLTLLLQYADNWSGFIQECQ